MSSIRIRFIRGEEVKYISHLDLMKAFERSIRRSGLPIAYTQGFNPHPMMVFGLPLSVGVTSEAEYADFELSEDMDPQEFAQRLNEQLPRGLKVTAAAEKLTKKNIMATVSMASYEVLVGLREDADLSSLKNTITELIGKSEVMVQKKTKRGLKDVNIRPMIHRLEAKELPDRQGYNKSKDICSNEFIINYARCLEEEAASGLGSKDQNMFCLSMLLSAGSGSSLNPDLLMEALKAMDGMLTKVFKIHRTGLFVGFKGKILDPLDPDVLQT